MIRYRTFLIPLVAAGLAIGAYVVPKPSESPRRPDGVKISQATYACPAGAGITVAAGQLSAGDKATATVLPGKTADAKLGNPATWRTSEVDGGGVIVEQSGRASGAAGFFGATAPKSSGGGLVVGSCPDLVDDAWYLGLGSGAKHFSSVVLTNVGDTPAAVDMELWGPEGKIDTVNATGIVIKPFTTKRVRLDDLAAGEPELALHVLRRRGSVSAVVNDLSTAVFGGTEPVSATASPRRTQVIGGLVSGANGRTLALLNPGTTTARVEVEVIGPKNTFKPEGLGAVKVEGGTVQLIDVPTTAGSGRQALRITSDVPVAATVRMAPGDKDFAYAEAVPALVGPAIVPVEMGKDVSLPDLILSAPGKDSSVHVSAFGKDMKQIAEVDVAVGGATTQHLDTAKAFTQKGIAYLVVRAKGEVVAAATYKDGGRISSLALLSAPLTVLAPQVRPID